MLILSPSYPFQPPITPPPFKCKQHIILLVGVFVIVGRDGSTYKSSSREGGVAVYRGEDAVMHFIDQLLKIKQEFQDKLMSVAPMQLPEEEEQAFIQATVCHICKSTLGEKHVWDHCHISSKFRGYAHPFCNLNYKQTRIIPVVFHNLKKYDAHHTFQKLGCYPDLHIDVIAGILEDYITVKLKEKCSSIQFSFIDSLQFLPASLEKLTSNLHPCDFKILKENFSATIDLNLLTLKGVYPYLHFNNLQ